jgi:hydroxyacylglutathione hydrolase
LSGAVHIPLHELVDRLGELPAGELWVYCQSGYRATIAASLLLRAGRQRVTAIDDALDQAASSALSV